MIKKQQHRRSFRHLNQYSRDRIELLIKAGHKQYEIADILKVSKSCISRELKKNITAPHKNCLKKQKSCSKK